MRLLPYWPKHRHIELAAKHWLAMRAKLNQAELDSPLGRTNVPANQSAE